VEVETRSHTQTLADLSISRASGPSLPREGRGSEEELLELTDLG